MEKVSGYIIIPDVYDHRVADDLDPEPTQEKNRILSYPSVENYT